MSGPSPSTSPTSASDAELVQAALIDPQAFSAVFARYHRDIYLYCLGRLHNAADADDAAATIFMKAYQALDRFRPRNDGSGMTFRSWLFAIAHNVVVDVWRKPHRTISYDVPERNGWVDSIPSASPDPEHQVIQADGVNTIMTALDQLPERQRSVVELRLAGLSLGETASALGLTRAAAKANQFRGYQRLRELLLVEQIDPAGEEILR